MEPGEVGTAAAGAAGSPTASQSPRFFATGSRWSLARAAGAAHGPTSCRRHRRAMPCAGPSRWRSWSCCQIFSHSWSPVPTRRP